MDLMGSAFRLAYFLYRDEHAARQITLQALTKMEAAAVAQEKRLYYKPQRQRTRVSMSREQLLQRLVYRCCEPYEKRHQKPSRDDLTVWFVKHLVETGLRRNSFHVTLALCRLLYRYSTAETMTIYDLVAQDEDCHFEADYCRARKRVLLGELRQRFEPVVRLRRGPHGEVGLETEEADERQRQLIHQCLERFTPWGTHCPIRSSLDVWHHTLPELTWDGHHPDGVHRIEMLRIHAVLHPGCLAALTQALGLDPPVARLVLPRWFLPGDEPSPDRPGEPRHSTPRLPCGAMACFAAVTAPETAI